MYFLQKETAQNENVNAIIITSEIPLEKLGPDHMLKVHSPGTSHSLLLSRQLRKK